MGDFNHSLNIIEHDKYTKNVRSAIVDCLTTINNDQQKMYPISQQTLKEILSLDARIDKVEYDLGVLSKQISIYKDHVESQEAKLVELSAADVSQNQQITNATNTININVNTINAINNKLSGYEDINNDNRTIAEGNSAELEELYEMVNSDKMIGFEGTYINAKDSIKGMTANTEIRGRTIQNLNPHDNTVYTAEPGKNVDVWIGYNFIPDEHYIVFADLISTDDVPSGNISMLVFDGAWQTLGSYTKALEKGVIVRAMIEFKMPIYQTIINNPDRQQLAIRTNRSITNIVVVAKNQWDGSQLPYFSGMRSACDIEKQFKPEISNVARYAKEKLKMYLNPNPGIEYNKLVNNTNSSTYVWPVKKGRVYGYKNGGNRNVIGFFDKKPAHGVAGNIVKEMSTSNINKSVLDVPGDGWIAWYVDDGTNGAPGVCILQYNEGQSQGSVITRPEPMVIQTSHGNGLMSISGANDVDGYIGDIIKRTPNGIQVEENITKFILNGASEQVYRRNSDTKDYTLFYLEIMDINKLITNEFGMSDTYPVLPYHKAAASSFNFKYVKPSKDKYLFINVKKTDLTPHGGTDVEHLRKYLAANPITVYCKTKTTRYVDMPRVTDMEFKTNDIPNGTLITSGNEIAPIIKTMVPCDPSAVIATLRRSNLSLQDDNLKLRTRVANLDETARQQDLHQATVDLDVDFRLYMMERSNPNSSEQLSDKAIVKTEPSLQFNLMKKLIDAGMYDKNDFINKALYYTDGGILSQNEYKQITEMMKGGNI